GIWLLDRGCCHTCPYVHRQDGRTRLRSKTQCRGRRVGRYACGNDPTEHSAHFLCDHSRNSRRGHTDCRLSPRVDGRCGTSNLCWHHHSCAQRRCAEGRTQHVV